MNTMLRSFEPEPPFEPEPQKSRPHRHRGWRIFGWAAGGLLVLLLITVAGAALLLNSTAFHNYVLAKANSTASEQLGVRVNLQNFGLHLSDLSLDVYGVTVAGATPFPNPPLLQLQHAEVQVKIVSLLQGKWYLRDLRLDHPIVQIYVDKNGNSNLPKPKSSNNKKKTSIFDLGIRHAVLDHGDVYYNDRKLPLDADLHDLLLQASYDSPQQKYSGELSYHNGQILFGQYRPFEHNLDAQFDYTPSAFQLNRATLSSGSSRAELSAIVQNFDAPVVQAKYNIVVDGGQMATLLKNPSIPAGMVRASGQGRYEDRANQPLLNSVTLNGDLLSNHLAVHSGTIAAAIDNLAAHYSLDHGNAALNDLRAQILGGQVTAQGTMKDLGGNSHSDFTTQVHNVSLGELKQLAGRSAATQDVNLAGVVNANATASWGKTTQDLIAHADATIQGNASPRQAQAKSVAVVTTPSAVPPVVPINSELHAVYTGANGQVTLTRSYLRTPQTSLTMNGTVSNHSSLAINLQANDLRELAAVANSFRSGTANSAPLQLAGRATFTGTVQGSMSAPHLNGQLSASGLQVNGTDWKVLRSRIDANPSQVRLQDVDLEPSSQGRITLNSTVGLRKWAFTKDSPISVELNASQIDIANLEKLAGKQIPVSGTLNTHVTLHGSEVNPVGNGNLTLSKLTAYDEPISSVQITFHGTGAQVDANLGVQLPSGTVQGKVSVQPKNKTYNAQLSSSGLQLANFQFVKAKHLDLDGALNIQAAGQGSFDNPQLAASLQIPTLTLQKQQMQGVSLKMDVANHVANATLQSAALHTNLQAKARINLVGDYMTDATVDTQGVPIEPLLATYSPAYAGQIQGQTELHATLHGPLKDRNAIEAHVTVPYLNLAYANNIQLAATSPIHADYAHGMLTVQRSGIRGTDTDLQFQGIVPVGMQGPTSLMLHGSVNLQLAQLFNPEIQSSGEVRFNIDSNGNGPNLGSEVDIVKANFAMATLPVGLQNGNGVLKLSTNRIDISSFEGTVGGGKVTASGGVAYRPNLQFDLGLAARNIRMLYPQGMRESIDGNVHLAGTTENAMLGGTVNVADISFTPGFDLTSFMGQFSGGVSAPRTQGMAQNIHLNVAVHSTNNVNLVSRTLSVNGSANLQVRGTADQPVILGRVNLSGGDVILNNDRFVLNGGSIQFVNPYQTQPVVNVSISTTIQQYNIDLRFSGPTDHLQTQYTSDPSLPQADIINLLAFGQTTEASAYATANNAGPSATQTGESVVASQVSSQITSRISKAAGISQLSISPVLGNGTTQGNGANITIQQRVTGNLFITFSDNTATTQDQVIQGQYKVSPRVSVSATRDPNGGFAVDTLIKKTW